MALYGPVPKRAAGKVHRHLDEHDRSFIASSPFLVLATAQEGGLLDVSPRGDRPGFVTVLDGDRLVLPDRPGNNRIDSLLNVLSDPRASMIFLIPGVGQTLRVNGTATVSTDEALLRLGAVGDRLPATALVLAATEILYQCPRALVRSRLWDPGAQVPRRGGARPRRRAGRAGPRPHAGGVPRHRGRERRRPALVSSDVVSPRRCG